MQTEPITIQDVATLLSQVDGITKVTWEDDLPSAHLVGGDTVCFTLVAESKGAGDPTVTGWEIERFTPDGYRVSQETYRGPQLETLVTLVNTMVRATEDAVDTDLEVQTDTALTAARRALHLLADDVEQGKSIAGRIVDAADFPHRDTGNWAVVIEEDDLLITWIDATAAAAGENPVRREPATLTIPDKIAARIVAAAN